MTPAQSAADARFLNGNPDARILVMLDCDGIERRFHALEPFATDFRRELEALGFRLRAIAKGRDRRAQRNFVVDHIDRNSHMSAAFIVSKRDQTMRATETI